MIHTTLLFLSGPDMIVIGIIALFLFGGKKIPEFAKGLGQSIRHFKEASEDKKDDAPKDNNQGNK